ncbi:ATP-binding protein [Geobacter sp. SVR]|uniref:ATP-binding protein n=1 Tax=Geobacter sp. SVR TaxID=2495594 RepID=UPI001565DFF4|nr:ATP-binding protein [Geobacter sp. SVR]
MIRHFSIRTKLIVIMLAAGLPVIAACCYDIYSRYETEHKKAEQAALAASRAIAFQHAARVEGVRNLLITLSEFPEVRQKDGRACTAILGSILRQSPSSLNIGIADLEGNLVASGVPGNFNIRDRKYFQDALRTRRFSAGEYTVSRSVGKPSIHFSLPVLDHAGNPVVVLYATFDLTQFDAIFDAQKLPENAVLNVTDHRGVVILRYPDHETVKPGLQDLPHLRSRVTGPDEEGVFVDVGLDNVKRLLAFTRLSLRPGDPPYLYIRVSIPEDEALVAARRFLIGSMFVFVLAASLTLAATRILSGRYFVVPVEKMAAASQSLARGNLAIRTNVPYTGDELGQLAQSFDSMTDSLRIRLHERDQAEALLKESEEKFHAIFDSLNDAVLIHDLETGTILDVNQAMCSMFGYSRHEALQLDVERLSLGEPPYSQREALAWMALTAEGQPQLFEWRSKHRDGRLFWTEISMRMAAIGGVNRLIVLVRDISERKAAEDEKRCLTEQLNQAQRIESIGRLAGGIAHDFNNLLTPIIGYAELVHRTADPVAREQVGQIMQAAGRARELTQQLLSFGRKQMLDMHIMSLNQLISDFTAILRRTIRENIDIRLLLGPDIERICADRNQVEQVIMNLVVNAQDAIEGVGVITIETCMATLDGEYARSHADAVPGSFVMLAISDSGCGMSKETMQHIFEPFFTTKEVGQGSGFGLATVYGIVKQHGGSVWVYSEPEKGTVFKLYFPSVQEQPRERQPEAVNESAHQGRGVILLVEDNGMVRSMVRELLEMRGYEVIEADTPSKALELAKDTVLDLLISDMIMPEMNGNEMYRCLAKHQPGLRVLFMSGYTDSVIVQQGQLEKGAGFIQKPFSVAAMENKVAEILAGGPEPVPGRMA